MFSPTTNYSTSGRSFPMRASTYGNNANNNGGNGRALVTVPEDDSDVSQFSRFHQKNESFASSVTSGSYAHNRHYSDEYDADTGLCASPSSWIAAGICDVSSLGKDKFGKLWHSIKNRSRDNSSGSRPPIASVEVPTSKQERQRWRDKAARQLFSEDSRRSGRDSLDLDSDDDEAAESAIGGATEELAAPRGNMINNLRLRDREEDTGRNENIISSNPNSCGPIQRHSFLTDGGLGIDSDASSRIIAPNVAKLSASSCVEIKLHSGENCVTVLCAVDVLKMRSVFFQNILAEQDQSQLALVNHHRQGQQGLSDMWRAPIVVPETSPYEAAAFLESMHEVRPYFRDWNFCWARLSVYWTVVEIAQDYAAQVDKHVEDLLSFIHSRHWRTNPHVLAGMRVAMFRKQPSTTPTILLGRVLDVPSGVQGKAQQQPQQPLNLVVINSNLQSHLSGAVCDGNSFPEKLTSSTASVSNSSTTSTNAPTISAAATAASTISTKLRVIFEDTHCSPSSPKPPTTTANLSNNSRSAIVGDVVEPFWVQPATLSDSNPTERLLPCTWYDPDEYCVDQTRKELCMSDIRIFWEMVRVMIELDQFRCLLKGRMTSVGDLTEILLQRENSLLWTADAAQYLPRECATVLLTRAYSLSYPLL